MVLNWSTLIPEFINRYCGMCWYLANSAAQAAGESGGRTPTTGSHSVIDRPERVSRVIPPITTMTKIMAQQHRSQMAIGRKPDAVAAAACGGDWMIAVGSDTPVLGNCLSCQ